MLAKLRVTRKKIQNLNRMLSHGEDVLWMNAKNLQELHCNDLHFCTKVKTIFEPRKKNDTLAIQSWFKLFIQCFKCWNPKLLYKKVNNGATYWRTSFILTNDRSKYHTYKRSASSIKKYRKWLAEALGLNGVCGSKWFLVYSMPYQCYDCTQGAVTVYCPHS